MRTNLELRLLPNHKAGTENSPGGILGHARRPSNAVTEEAKQKALEEVYESIERDNVTKLHGKSYDLKTAENLCLLESLEPCHKRERLAAIDAKAHVDAYKEHIAAGLFKNIELEAEIADLKAREEEHHEDIDAARVKIAKLEAENLDLKASLRMVKQFLQTLNGELNVRLRERMHLEAGISKALGTS